ncbi:aminotransferase class I/II-fold pyridoxal phosphate-dependent enzyme [Candidatus Desantisbacteria bacterium]|nr:aminotransferase class I/II-fold pyridoxal phosphate-dependent enzyme [Candidatus Desantisbacteria bacterium]
MSFFNIAKLVRREIFEIKPYIPAKPIEEIEREYKVKNLVQLISNENPFSISPETRKRIHKELKTVNRYPDGGGFYLKKKLAEKFKVKSENIILGNGADEVLSMLCEAFLNKGEEVIMGQPSFSAYEISCRIMGGIPVFAKLDNFKFNLKNILGKVTRKTKIIFLKFSAWLDYV